MSNYLPEDLAIEILYRVPVKHLVKFLVVSKSWYSLITSPNFRNAHLNRIRQQKLRSNSSSLLIRGYTSSDQKEHYVLHSDDEEAATELDFPFKSQLGYMRVVGGCDGLVCLSDDFLTVRGPIYLWNPSVQKYIELPSPIIYPPSPHMFVLGFGTDCRGDHKVVRIVFHKDGQLKCILPPEVEVYSLSVGLWRRILNVSVNLFLAEFYSVQASLNASLHWISYAPRTNRDGGSFTCLILRFDLENEVFSEMMLPDELGCLHVGDLAVNVCQGNLAIMANHMVEGHLCCSIWVMKQHGVVESWTRLFSFDLVGGMDRVVGFHRSGDAFLAKEAGELVVFDPRSNQSQGLGVLGSTRSFYVCDFEESLILLERQNVIAANEQGSGGNSSNSDSLEQERVIDGRTQLRARKCCIRPVFCHLL